MGFGMHSPSVPSTTMQALRSKTPFALTCAACHRREAVTRATQAATGGLCTAAALTKYVAQGSHTYESGIFPFVEEPSQGLCCVGSRAHGHSRVMGHHTVVAGLGHGGRCAAQRGNQHADAVAACRRGCGLQRKRPANTCFTCDFCFPTHNCNSVAASRPSRCACHGGSEHFAFFCAEGVLDDLRRERLAGAAPVQPLVGWRAGACTHMGSLACKGDHWRPERRLLVRWPRCLAEPKREAGEGHCYPDSSKHITASTIPAASTLGLVDRLAPSC